MLCLHQKITSMALSIIAKPSPNFSAREHGIIDSIILHHTATPTCKMALDILTDGTREPKVSSHYVIDRNGDVYQLVDDAEKAWHAGVSYWRGREKMNEYSIGIEIVNTGYEVFPDLQMDAVVRLCQTLCAKHSIDSRNIVGHSDIAPGRKVDPNEHFNWKLLASYGIGIWSDATCSERNAKLRLGQKVYAKLHTFGYAFDQSNRKQVVAVVKAFKRHHVPETYAAAGWDKLSDARLTDLLEKYYE